VTTPASLPGTRAHKETLRRGLMAIVIGAVIYVTVVAIVMVTRLGPAAAVLQRTSEDALQEFVQSQQRTAQLDTVARALEVAVSGDSTVDSDWLHRTRRELQAMDARARAVERLAPGPRPETGLRAILAGEMQNEDDFRIALLGAIAAMEIGDIVAVRREVGRAREREGPVREAITRAAGLVLEDVRAQQRTLARDARTAVQLLAVWLSVGLVLVPLVLRFLRRRLQEPLAALDEGFDRVSAGDFSVQLSTESGDELARIGEHFNTMTAILRQRASEEAARAASQTAARMRLILDSALDAVVVIDERGIVREWNPRAELTFGWGRQDAIGHTLSELIIPPEQREAHTAGLIAYSKGGPPRMLNRLVEAEAITRDGTRISVELTITRLERDGVVEFSAFIRDVSEKRRLEHELREAQKLEAIGQLAGGVAHDFNNLLTAIIGNADLICEDPDATGQIREDATQIASVAGRGAALSRSLLTLARRGGVHGGTETFAISSIVREVVDIVSRVFDRRIRIALDLDDDERTVRGDRSQVLNAILNLALNARDAMPDGGELAFGARIVEPGPAFFARHPGDLRPGSFVELTVRDTGEGITPEVRERMFEPFFTTKDIGQGSGLGLAMVYGTVRGHHGVIDVESSPGRGSTFRVWFPVEGEGSASSPPIAFKPSPGRGRILLVDDELDVRTAGARLLRSLGYTVETARDGLEAVELVRAWRSPFDLVILDGNMPRMTGSETARVIRTMQPDLLLVLATGYFEPALEATFASDGFTAAIAKPYSLATLSRELARVLQKQDRPD
jgi:PAS domain S-box-containing protein